MCLQICALLSENLSIKDVFSGFILYTLEVGVASRHPHILLKHIGAVALMC